MGIGDIIVTTIGAIGTMGIEATVIGGSGRDTIPNRPELRAE